MIHVKGLGVVIMEGRIGEDVSRHGREIVLTQIHILLRRVAVMDVCLSTRTCVHP